MPILRLHFERSPSSISRLSLSWLSPTIGFDDIHVRFSLGLWISPNIYQIIDVALRTLHLPNAPIIGLLVIVYVNAMRQRLAPSRVATVVRINLVMVGGRARGTPFSPCARQCVLWHAFLLNLTLLMIDVLTSPVGKIGYVDRWSSSGQKPQPQSPMPLYRWSWFSTIRQGKIKVAPYFRGASETKAAALGTSGRFLVCSVDIVQSLRRSS
jgi:hypothetical protein